MASNMRYLGQLRKAETFHELLVRGVEVSYSHSTLREMREKLATVIATPEEEWVDKVKNTVDEELALAGALMEDAANQVEACEGETRGASSEKTRALLSHLNRRLSRLMLLAGSDAKAKVTEALKELKELVTRFRQAGEGSVFDASSVCTKSRRDKSQDRSKSDRDDSEEEAEKPKSSSKSASARLDVHKWGIKFAGQEGSSVITFITEVEEKAGWKGVELNSLLVAASEFFEGSAKIWYRSVKREVDSWEELKRALRKEYLPLDYYDHLWDELRARKQGPNEGMGAYVACMLGLFERLELGEAVEEEQKLTLIKKNLHPSYLQKLALVPVRSIRELKEYGKHLELAMARADAYEGKGGKNRLVEPEFACPKGSRGKPVVNAVETPPASVKAAAKKPTLCWNCRAEGHRFSKCDKEVTSKFCFRCGNPGETTVSCKRCASKPKGPQTFSSGSPSKNE